MSELLRTQEVGSLAKQSWRVQPLQGLGVRDEHIDEAVNWAERLGETPEEANEVLRTAQEEGTQLSSESADSIKNLAARYAIRLQEKAGLDILYDGEQDRPEMYQSAVEDTVGFEPRGRLRAFDNRSFLKSAVVGQPGITAPWYTQEFQRIRQLTDKTIKVPVTGAYTVADWSFDEYYQKSITLGGKQLAPKEAKRQFVLDVAEQVVRPNIKSLLKQGAEWIQIDEPAATTKPHEVALFVESFNRSIQGLAGRFSVHICFSDYSLLFPHVQQLENCAQFSLEFANSDAKSLGRDKAHRPAYEILGKFATDRPDIGIGLGVTSIHENQIESPELVRDRILRAVDIIGDAAKVYPSPDCGLRTRSWDVAYKKFSVTVEGACLARNEFE